MANFFGSIDLTLLGQIVREHPELKRDVQMKDGTTHSFINIDVYDKMQPDQFGNLGSIKVSCKKENRKENLKYYIANLKYSQYQDSAPANTQQSGGDTPPPPTDVNGDDLPF